MAKIHSVMDFVHQFKVGMNKGLSRLNTELFRLNTELFRLNTELFSLDCPLFFIACFTGVFEPCFLESWLG